jgi:poly-beta-1,6-N-acetyl-D-glucosamine N-deacetylase
MKRFLLLGWILLFVQAMLFAQHHFVAIQYHHFGNTTPPSTSVTLEQFKQHLAYLEKNQFTVLAFEEALHLIRTGEQLPLKSVVITIDDAYLSIYNQAFPLLKQKGWPLTIFVSTEAIDKGYKGFLTWSQLKEMAKNGTSIGMHSHTHPYLVRELTKMSPEHWKKWAKEEIETSRQRIKRELGVDSGLFAYPYGEYNLALKEIVAELGLVGVGQHSGVIWSGSDYLALPRFPVSGIYADIKDFSVKLNALPLPVISVEPAETIVSVTNKQPILYLRLASGNYLVDQLRCYASGQGCIEIKWTDRVNHTLAVIPKQALPLGRSKYNCTAPQAGSNRYYWYSRQWLRLK